MAEPRECRCYFVKSERGSAIYCTRCGRSPEGIVRNGPEACRPAAREAQAKYRDDRMERGGMTRDERGRQ